MFRCASVPMVGGHCAHSHSSAAHVTHGVTLWRWQLAQWLLDLSWPVQRMSRADSQGSTPWGQAFWPGVFHSVAGVTVSRCGGAAGARLLRACRPVSRLSQCCMWLGNHVTTTLGSSCTTLGFVQDHLAVPLCHVIRAFHRTGFLPVLRGVHPSQTCCWRMGHHSGIWRGLKWSQP